MTTKARTHAPHNAQSVPDEYRRWVQARMPALANLLDALDAGRTPNFLDIMAGLSQMVAFYTDCDILDGDESMTFSQMSGKKCRFCC